MRRTLLLLTCALAACPDPEAATKPSGTSVGNPGKGVSRIAPPEGLEIVEAFVDLTWQAVSCEGGAVPVGDAGGQPVDLLLPPDLAWPPGSYCAVTAELGALEVAAEGPEDTTVELSLQLGGPLTLWAIDRIDVDAHSYVLELGNPGWISAEGLPIEPGGNLVIASGEGDGQELHDAAALEIIEGTALYLDDDDDGVLDEAERAAGPVASTLDAPPADWEPLEPDTGAALGDDDRLSGEGCNCGTGTPGGAWLWLAAAALLRRRLRAPRGTAA